MVSGSLRATSVGLDDVLTAVAHAVYAVDADFNLVVLNERALTATGLSLGEAVGMKCYEAFKCVGRSGPCPAGARNRPAASGCDAARRPHSLDSAFERRACASPLLLEGHDRPGWLVSVEDSTVERVTSEFVAVAAHELRTPMTSIKAYVSLLLSGRFGPLGPEQEHALEVVERNVDRLVQFTTDLLILSRLEASGVKLAVQLVDARDILAAALAAVAGRLARNGVTAAVDFRGCLTVTTDGDRLRQVVDHLLDNAVRFAPPLSGIAITAVGSPADLSISISNRGGAIPEDKMAHIFAKFYQCDGVDSALQVGKGLGLAICQGLVHLMGGEIWATNHDDGLGVTFAFMVPSGPCS